MRSGGILFDLSFFKRAPVTERAGTFAPCLMMFTHHVNAGSIFFILELIMKSENDPPAERVMENGDGGGVFS